MSKKQTGSFPREIRFIKLLELIDTKKPVDIQYLSNELGISKRQILRDIKKLRSYYDICYDRKNKTYYVYNCNFDKLDLSKNEILSLVLSEKIISKYKGTPYEQAIKTALNKIKSSISPEKQPCLVDFNNYFYIDFLQGRDYTMKSSLFDALFDCMKNQKTVEILYCSGGEGKTTRREVDPYGFIHSIGTWYFIGFCHLRKGIRKFAIDRILQLKNTEKNFKRPNNFNLEKYIGKSWHIFDDEIIKVRIKFSPEISYIIKNQKFHPSQELEFNNDGSIVASYEVAGTGEIKRWILSFGSKVEVISPEILREEIKQEIEKMKQILG